MASRDATLGFTYTAERAGYLATVAAFGALLAVEAGLFVFLTAVLLPAGWLRWILWAGLAALDAFVFASMFSPLWTRHRLTPTHLHLRYGVSLSARIPRTAILSARPVRERLGPLGPLEATRASYDRTRRRIRAAFSEKGEIVVRLDRPYPFRLGILGSVLAEEILINVDQPELLLRALAPPDRSPAPPPVAPLPAPAPVPRAVPRAHVPAAAGDPLIRTEELARRYGDFAAVTDLDLEVRPGEIYGFLGANGAGKTTTIKMLVGLLEPTAGRVWVAGHDVWKEPLAAKAELGYVADRSPLYERLTGREFLMFIGRLRGLPPAEIRERVDELLDRLELTPRADDPCRIYSFGMKRKLSLAAAMIHRPRVLILDEPLNGLDPRSSRRLKDLFAELASGGSAIFLSTHDLATAEAVCHRVGIIHRGRMVAEGSVDELRRLVAGADLEEIFLQLTADQGEDA